MSITKFEDVAKALDSQIVELSDSDLHGNELKERIQRARAVAGCAEQIIGLGNMLLNAERLRLEYAQPTLKQPLLAVPVSEKDE